MRTNNSLLVSTVFTRSIRIPHLQNTISLKLNQLYSYYMFMCLKPSGLVANSVDTDETPYHVASDLGHIVCPKT